MEKVIVRLHDAFEDIRYNLDSNIKWFDNTLPQVENCFEFLRKRAMSTRDLLKLFGSHWPLIDREMKKKEFLQRVTIIIWSNYVFNLSSIEFFIKNIIKASTKGSMVDWLSNKTEDAARNRKQFRMYLHSIMKESKQTKLITKTQLNTWIDMIELRNAIIHNNGVFDKDDELEIGDVKTITKVGKSIETQLVNYPKFMTVLIDLTRDWIRNYLNLHEI